MLKRLKSPIFFILGLSVILMELPSAEGQIHNLRSLKTGEPSRHFMRDLSPELKREVLIPPEQRSRKVPALLSVILPGLGEYSTGHKRMAKLFFSIEGALWGSVLGFYKYYRWKMEDYKTFASFHAGVDNRRKGERFYVDIGNFMDIYSYNEKQYRDREPEDAYEINSSYFWKWDSDASRREYYSMRVQSDRAKRNISFVVGGLILNRIVSLIDLLYLERRAEKGGMDARSSVHFNLSTGIFSSTYLVSFSINF
ncbi:MAG: hypothetical protein ACE5QV_02440 [Fidelibacterota bacterium]